MSDLTGFIFSLIEQVPVLDLDYTPRWGRGNPSQYIDNVTFKKVLTTKKWMYRIVKGGDDLGVQAGYTVESDGAHRVNFLAYNAGHGIMDTLSILVYVVDPDNGNQFLVAKWNPN
ncbi:Immunomodulatory protein Ling Zhi-8 [Lentinus tigrinus ALCF2SS1-6]|uniref:Immunomodulatory protein Ling Zhi-8 n=1 Tax=Lentinus tigrinus ALCF2SS1-6 TaxID=1328759 RepID=A0A5C2SJP9_9APHY|nr:Immunomodulatory protein Ling Zhi-8 [Lentinus tigrinus ALCF2SS1-6]